MRAFTLILAVLFLGLTSCNTPEKGCTNPKAKNYNPDAEESDGSCIIEGCTDPDASNYDADATENNGTCKYIGCMDPNADNYDPKATEDSGECLYKGCTDVQSDQYDPQANSDDKSCKTYFNRWSHAFTGDFTCEGSLLNSYFGEATMAFSKADIPDNMDSIKVDMTFSLSSLPFSFGATISRETMYANAFFPEFQTDFDIVPTIEGEVFDIYLTGKMAISEDNENVNGTLVVKLVEKALNLGIEYTDSCVFDGKK